MNKSKSKTKCCKQQNKKKVESTEEVPVRKSMKLDIDYGESPKSSSDARVSGHSTPIQKKEYPSNIEDSPELDYRCSPILLPCTQEGGNEVAWDWQSCVSKTTNEKDKVQNNLIETPKRTKLLQKKRNSNSPLLQKPLKRKQVKMENMENIGKLTAELKALTERMRSMKQSRETHTVTKDDDETFELETPLVIELNAKDNDNEMLEVVMGDGKASAQTIVIDNNNKKCSSYEELFDDSIDDSMAKCSQEVEEKFNLGKTKVNGVVELSTVSEEKELSSIYEKDVQYLTNSNNSVDSFKNINISKSSSTINTSGLKTYSKNSSKTSSTSSILNSKSRDMSFQKSYFNNNAINVTKGSAKNRHLLQEGNNSDLFDIPDDSFDDCLATFLEDDKVLSKSSEYAFSDVDDNFSYNGKTSKQTNSNTAFNKKTSNNFIPKASTFSHSNQSNNHDTSKFTNHNLAVNMSTIVKEKTRPCDINTTATASVMENRKFFKTKSLSANSVSSSVSTTFPVIRNHDPCQGRNFSSINGVENTHALDRFRGEDDGSGIIKYKSTSNLCYNKKQTAKDSQAVQCTAEEIEKKRLEAKMRLEAKRKLQQNMKIPSTPSEIPVKRPVKR